MLLKSIKVVTYLIFLQIYMVLFNEANMCNLLETTMYSNEACVGLNDSALDLTDYCVRNLSLLICADQIQGGSGGGWDPFNSDQDSAEENCDSLTASDLSQQLAEWKPGMELPNIPVEDVSDEIKRHRREIGFQVIVLPAYLMYENC